MPQLNQQQGSLPAEGGLRYGLYGRLVPLKPSCFSGRGGEGGIGLRGSSDARAQSAARWSESIPYIKSTSCHHQWSLSH